MYVHEVYVQNVFTGVKVLKILPQNVLQIYWCDIISRLQFWRWIYIGWYNKSRIRRKIDLEESLPTLWWNENLEPQKSISISRSNDSLVYIFGYVRGHQQDSAEVRHSFFLLSLAIVISNNLLIAASLKRYSYPWHIDGLVQERRNFFANALELRLSCTDLLICF